MGSIPISSPSTVLASIISTLRRGLKLHLFFDRDDTLGICPSSLDEQTCVIGSSTISHLLFLQAHDVSVTIISGRRVAELHMEEDVHKLRTVGCTGNWLSKPGIFDGEAVCEMPDSTEKVKNEISSVVKDNGWEKDVRLDYGESKLSARCALGDKKYTHMIQVFEGIGQTHQEDWKVMKYERYALVELVPKVANKAQGVRKVMRECGGIKDSCVVYFGNGGNDLDAFKWVSGLADGCTVNVGGNEVLEKWSAFSVRGYKCTRKIVAELVEWWKAETGVVRAKERIIMPLRSTDVGESKVNITAEK